MTTAEHRLPTRQTLLPDLPAFDPGALDEQTRDALAELLLAMADDEFICGFWDSEWTGIAPLLEEDVAFSSLAQDEIGHARLLYEMYGRLTGADPDRTAFHRAPEEYTARPPARPSAHRLGLLDLPALAVRHRRRGPPGGAGELDLQAAGGRGGQDPARGALPPDAPRCVDAPARRSRGRAARRSSRAPWPHSRRMR